MYDVNYYEVIPNKDFINLSFTPKNDIKKNNKNNANKR